MTHKVLSGAQEHGGDMYIRFNRVFMDRLMLLTDDGEMAKLIAEKVKAEVISRVCRNVDYSALESEILRRIREDVGKAVLRNYDPAIRKATDNIIKNIERDIGEDVAGKRAELSKLKKEIAGMKAAQKRATALAAAKLTTAIKSRDNKDL